MHITPHAARPGGALGLVLLLALLGGCGKYLPKLDEVLPDKRTEYRKSESLPDLEVPPDLTSDTIQDSLAVPDIDETGAATYSTYQERIAARQRAREAAQADEAAVQALADEKVLVVGGDVAAVWADLRRFFVARGVALELDDAELGVMETTWAGSADGLARTRTKIYGEPGQDPATTVLYLTLLAEAQQREGEDLVWVERPRDAAAENELVASLRAHFGQSASVPASTIAGAAPSGAVIAAAPTGLPSELVSAGEGRVFLSIPEDYAIAWERTGEALAAAGFIVEEADRTRGVYRIALDPALAAQAKSAAEDDRSFVDRLAFWRDDDEDEDDARSDPSKRQLSLTGVGAKTEVVVLDGSGKWDDSPAAGSILTTLQQRLNGN